MAYETYRVEITRDETIVTGGETIDITAYFDRVPEHDNYTRGFLTRAPRGVWNSRMVFAGDFDDLGEALAAISTAVPGAERIRCYEYTIDDEYAREVAPLLKTGDKWRPKGDPEPGNPE
jgi:hypothetical protein